MSTTEAARGHRRARGLAPVSCDGIQGRLLDISRDGVAFSVKTHFEHFTQGKVCQMSIKIPRSETTPEGVKMDFPGVVCHARMDEHQNRLVVGMHLEDLPEESQALINTIILFFAQNFATLQNLDDFFNTLTEDTDTVSEKTVPLQKHEELRHFYNDLFDSYNPLPETLQRTIVQHIQDIKKSFPPKKDT